MPFFSGTGYNYYYNGIPIPVESGSIAYWAGGGDIPRIWGDGGYDGTGKYSFTAVSSTRWNSLAIGLSHVAGIKSDGTLWSWGNNTYGQLGAPLPFSWVTAGATGDVGTNVFIGLALASDGTLWQWGRTLGTVPVKNTVSGSFTSLSCALRHAVALKSDGTVWMIGFNDNGQFGNNTFNNTQTTTWTQATTAPTSCVEVVAGAYSTFVRRFDGTIWSVGNNNYGQLGTNNIVNRSSFVQIGTSSWSAISAGIYVGRGIRSDGTLWSWGYNVAGAVGDNSTINRSSPVQIGVATNWTKVSGNHAINNTANLFALGGQNSAGYLLANGTVNNYFSSPVQISSGLSWTFVSSGLAAFGVTTTGALYAWGYNTNGMAGVNSASLSLTVMTRVGTDSNWKQAYCQTQNATNSFGIKTDGSMHGVGVGTSYSVGDGTLTTRSSFIAIGTTNTTTRYIPYQIGNSSNWTQVRATQQGTYAINSNGELFACGENTYGQIGDNTTIHRSSLVQVGSSITWTKLYTGKWAAAGIDPSSKLYTWGYNASGMLGDNTISNRSTPTQIAGSWNMVAVGGGHMLGLTSTNALWTWGNNTYGELGTNSIVLRSSPAQVGTSSWATVSAGDSHSTGITTAGTLFTWGYGAFGQLGSGTIANRSTPVQVGASSYTTLTASPQSTYMKTTSGNWYATGWNSYSVLGDATAINRSSPVLISSLAGGTVVIAGQNLAAKL